MFKLIVFDMDGVLADCNSSWVAVHDHFGVNNRASLEKFLKHEIDDYEFIEKDVELWLEKKPDITIQDIADILGEVKLMPNLDKLLQEVKGRGMHTAIVSGGLDVLANQISEMTGIEEVYSNGLLSDCEGRLTGGGVVRVPVLNKDHVVLAIQEKFGVSKEETISVGNSRVDAQMFKVSGRGIAFNPEDDIVRENADIVIESADLAEIIPYLD